MAETSSSVVNTAMNALNSQGVGSLKSPLPPELMKQMVDQRSQNVQRKTELTGQATEMQKSLAGISPVASPTFKETSAPPKYEPAKIDPGTLLAFGAMAVLGGMATRQPLINSMNALSAAFKGYNEGNDREFEHAMKSWQVQNEYIGKENDRISKGFDAAIKGQDQTIEQRKSQIEALLKQATNVQTEIKDIDEAFEKAAKWQETALNFKVKSAEVQLKMAQLAANKDTVADKNKLRKLQVDKARVDLDTARATLETKKFGGGVLVSGYQYIDPNNPKAGQVPIPGTAPYEAQRDKHFKDMKVLEADIDTRAGIVAKIQDFVDDPQFNLLFGRENRGTGTGVESYLTRFFAPNARRKMDELKGIFSAEGLKRIRESGSPGSITEKEWLILEAQVMKISQLAKPSQAIEGLSRVVDELRDNVNRNIGDYQTRWGDSPFFEPGLVQAADFKLKTPGEKAKDQEVSSPEAKSIAHVPYDDPEKERRYQEFLEKKGR